MGDSSFAPLEVEQRLSCHVPAGQRVLFSSAAWRRVISRLPGGRVGCQLGGCSTLFRGSFAAVQFGFVRFRLLFDSVRSGSDRFDHDPIDVSAALVLELLSRQGVRIVSSRFVCFSLYRFRHLRERCAPALRRKWRSALPCFPECLPFAAVRGSALFVPHA